MALDRYPSVSDLNLQGVITASQILVRCLSVGQAIGIYADFPVGLGMVFVSGTIALRCATNR